MTARSGIPSKPCSWHLRVRKQGDSYWATRQMPTLKNLWSSSCDAVGRLEGSFTRHLATISRMACMR